MTKNCENSEIIQKEENTNMHTYSLFLSLSVKVSSDDIMFINHNSILSATPTDLQL